MSALDDRIADLQRKHPPVPAPQVISQPPVLPHCLKLSGVVQQDARVRTEHGTGRTVLAVLFKQPLSSIPMLAVRHYDSTAASLTAAHSKAKRLRTGASVTVVGEGLRLRLHRGDPALEVLCVHSIDPPPEPTTRRDLE